MKHNNKWNEETLRAIVLTSNSKGEILAKIGIPHSGGNYQSLNARLQKWSISTDHFMGQGWSKGKVFREKWKSTDMLLINDSLRSSAYIRKRILRDGLKENKCEICGQGEIWNGNQLTLQLDHINGIHSDNRIENLRILCPNCHTQTPTHSGKNKKCKTKSETGGSRTRKTPLSKNGGFANLPTVPCKSCNKEFQLKSITQKYCSQECAHRFQRKIERPDLDLLQKLVDETSYCAVGKKFGVSDNAIRNWLKTPVTGFEPV